MTESVDFFKIFEEHGKPVKQVDKKYKLYYNKQTGKALQYSTEDLDGDYIEITKQQYAESRYDSIVLNGKLTSIIDAVRWRKLVPGNEGVACAVDNVMIVDTNSSVKWKVKTYYAD